MPRVAACRQVLDVTAEQLPDIQPQDKWVLQQLKNLHMVSRTQCSLYKTGLQSPKRGYSPHLEESTKDWPADLSVSTVAKYIISH